MKLSDMLFANAMMGEGGDGDSDFSTAEVTVVNNLPDDIPAYILGAFIVNDQLAMQCGYPSGTSTSVTVLYKNEAIICPDEYEDVNVSGNATIDAGGIVTVTGNCTITIIS